MAQKPAMRHVIAQIRLEIGLSQTELAKILGVAGTSIQKIEQGSLALSEELAAKTENELGISADWLLANDPDQLAVTPRGGRWTSTLYELIQGTPPGHFWRNIEGVPMKEAKKMTTIFTTLRAFQYHVRIFRALSRLKGRPKQGILLHRIEEAVKDWEDFSSDNSALDLSDKEILERYEREIAKLQNEFDALNAKITKSENEWIERGPATPAKSRSGKL